MSKQVPFILLFLVLYDNLARVTTLDTDCCTLITTSNVDNTININAVQAPYASEMSITREK